MHFGISEGKGGLKYGSCPSLCTDIFWNCPLHISVTGAWSSGVKTLFDIESMVGLCVT